MKTALMIIQIILSVLIIGIYLTYETKDNIIADEKVRETGKNAFLGKTMSICATLFMICAISQLLL